MIGYAGFRYMWAGADSPSEIAAARRKITNAVIGLVLLLSIYTILYQINPDILNLDALRSISTISSDPTDTSSETQTDTIGSGYASYEWVDTGRDASGNVQTCAEKNGVGWVTVDSNLCSRSAANGSECCAYSPSSAAAEQTRLDQQTVQETAKSSVLSTEVTYTAQNQIPTGSWCADLSSNGAPYFSCSNTQSNCVHLNTEGGNTPTCTQY